MMKVEREKRCEDDEHCGEKEVINEYEEKATINGILGDKVKILDIQEVEEGGFGGSDLKIEGTGTIRTYSKVLGGQIQHLKDTGKLPVVGTIEKKKSGKGGRSYYSFSPSSSFAQAKDEKTEGLSESMAKINKELAEKREIEEQEKEISEFMDY